MNALTPQQLEKDVKRINERINEVVKLLGSDSEAYHKYISKIKSLLPSQYVRVDKDGLVKIARKKELYQQAGNENIQRAFEQILKTPTAGQIRKQARAVLKEEKKNAARLGLPSISIGDIADSSPEAQRAPITITKDEIDQFAKLIDKISGFVADNNDMFYVAYKDPKMNEMIHRKGKRTYSELNAIITAYQDHQYQESTSVFEDIDF